MNIENKIELLNSEGSILVAIKRGKKNEYIRVYDGWKNLLGMFTYEQMREFVHGDLTITDSNNKVWKYSEQPGDMKPNLKELDEFIGIDTTDKTY